MSDLQLILVEPARNILVQVGQFIGYALVVLLILLVGWLLAVVIKSLVTKGLKALKVDWLSDRVELNLLLEKGGITYSFSELIGVFCYWIVLLVAVMVAVNAAGLTVAADLLAKVVQYIPNVIAALFILILGMFFATLLKNIVLTAANNAGLSQGKLLSKLVEVVVVIFAIVVALEQLGVGIQITQLTLAIILGSIGLGLALAFGLGCRDLAGRYVNDFIEKLKKK